MATREYPTVKRASADIDRLMAAHGKVINEQEAIKVIYAYLDEGEVEVRFTGKVNGHCYYCKPCEIVLPPSGSEYLTLGLVLHETSHALAWIDKHYTGHGQAFIVTLDTLIRSEADWSEEHTQEARP